jgi:hypothetical protein
MGQILGIRCSLARSRPEACSPDVWKGGAGSTPSAVIRASGISRLAAASVQGRQHGVPLENLNTILFCGLRCEARHAGRHDCRGERVHEQ